MAKPPKTPWKKGTHKDHSTLVVEVHVARDALGQVYSNHTLQDQTDHVTAMSWPGGGQEQIAFAMLVEAVRREAIVEMLLCMSQDPQFTQKVSEGLDEVVREMTAKLKAQLTHALDNLGEDAVREALSRIVSTPG